MLCEIEEQTESASTLTKTIKLFKVQIWWLYISQLPYSLLWNILPRDVFFYFWILHSEYTRHPLTCIESLNKKIIWPPNKHITCTLKSLYQFCLHLLLLRLSFLTAYITYLKANTLLLLNLDRINVVASEIFCHI